MNPFEILKDVKTRAAEAVIAQSGLDNTALADHLRQIFTSDTGMGGALLGEPVLEGAHPFEVADMSLNELSPRLLHPDLVKALDEGHRGREVGQRFPKDRKPFRHQLRAWEVLIQSQDAESVLVTSGTGSGKTECFLVPLLNHLVGQLVAGSGPLTGIQAIMLYPLNALIESQKERLTAWTAPFQGRIRFCLYNGDLRQAMDAETKRATPEQVLDRETLRRNPPPMLVTNKTMLEYMLARLEDAPILEQSQGKLRWIILDEAHSLVGAAAAEVALLLRRVLIAFGVRPKDVRFVATSATIGSGPDVAQRLKTFLSELAGIEDAKIHVIEGHRRMPPSIPIGGALPLPPDLRNYDRELLYRALASKPQIWSLVELLYRGAVPVSDVEKISRQFGLGLEEFVFALTTAAFRVTANGAEEILAPVRLHAFERAVPGVWSCINPECNGAIKGWQFGAISTERVEICRHCTAPVLEILTCSLCGEAILEGEEIEGRLSPPLRTPPRDEFQFEQEREDDGDDEDGDADVDEIAPIAISRFFAAHPTKNSRPVHFEKKNWLVLDFVDSNSLTLLTDDIIDKKTCFCCLQTSRHGSPLRPFRFGAPSLIGNTAPILLAGVEPSVSVLGAERVPFDGRQLLSFTDSRQGTARLSAKMQTEAERNFVRSAVYHAVQSQLSPNPETLDETARLQQEIKTLESVGPNSALEPMIAEKRSKLVALQNGNLQGFTWEQMTSRLAERIEVSNWLKQVWAQRDPSFEDTGNLAQFLLLREFTRRPRSGNSIETLGLAKLTFPAIDNLVDRDLPKIGRPLSLEDWKAFLYHCLTHFVRANRAIGIQRDLQIWIQPKLGLRYVIPGDPALRRTTQTLPWPTVPPSGVRSRVVSLLVKGLRLSLSDPADVADLNECLQKAWRALLPTLTWEGSADRVVAFNKARIAPLQKGYFCPVTRRILDYAAFGLSPYGLSFAGNSPTTIPIEMPRHPQPLVEQDYPRDAKLKIKDWLAVDPLVAGLRTRSAWNNISDRIALFADYGRSAEHSAQQPSSLLRRYEHEFKRGMINTLNCSTTMEMGVDIGSVSAVMMTNVPPSIASYRQRVGRAGRRGQPISLAFTFCKDRALDREAFRDPALYLRRSVAVPNVALTSKPIVQRHVNAFLLGRFIRENAGESLKMTIGGFLGCPESADKARLPLHQRPVAAFIEWIQKPSNQIDLQDALNEITRSSDLDGDRGLFDCTLSQIKDVEKEFCDAWEGLRQQVADEPLSIGGKSRLAVEMQRMTGDFLLGALAERGFLPGHGFPTHVVSFLPNTANKKYSAQISGENPWRAGRGPQRELDLAIRDYAPGSEIVLDGLVHKSAGLTLNWKRPASPDGIVEIQSLRCQWSCLACGTADTAGWQKPNSCPSCGSTNIESTNFIRPAGFMADSREKPHAQVDEVEFVLSEDPIVSVRDEDWISLPIPQNGRFRSTRQGLVFYSSRGAKREGYAICLHCGRAEAEELAVGLRSEALKDHKPLRRIGGEMADHCPGNEEPWKIRHHLALGHEIQTDVFEIQPALPISRPAATALIIAIREALAQELGVEADELGFAMKERLNDVKTTVISLYLYDRAAGGAGFAVEAGPRLKTVFANAERILDCNTQGCEHACSACVLTRDAPDGHGALDRKAALLFIRENLRLTQDLEPNEMFGADAVMSEGVIDEIDLELRKARSAVLNVYLPADTNTYELSAWRFARQLFDLAYRGRKANIIIPRSLIAGADTAQRLALKDFILHYHLQPFEGNAPVLKNGAAVLASVSKQGALSTVWASTEESPRKPGAKWGLPHLKSIARGLWLLDAVLKPIDISELELPPGAQFIEIRNELNGPSMNFGKSAANIMIKALKQASAWSDSPIELINYEDRYVRSPLVLKLLIDTVKALYVASGSKFGQFNVLTTVAGGDPRSPPFRIEHDWKDFKVQCEVAIIYGSFNELKVQLKQVEASHSRRMEIVFSDGRRSRIVLDQGFGAWGTPQGKPVKFDFLVTPEEQAKSLQGFRENLHQRGAGATYFVALAGK